MGRYRTSTVCECHLGPGVASFLSADTLGAGPVGNLGDQGSLQYSRILGCADSEAPDSPIRALRPGYGRDAASIVEFLCSGVC